MNTERYPLLNEAVQRGEVDGSHLPAERGLRCGPWDEREDGAIVCRKCGEVDVSGSGPAGF